MKKLAILSVSILLFACNSNNKQPETATTTTTETVTTTTDMHNARNSLDYEGTYKGDLPTASGTGMEVTIKLDDNKYEKEIKYKAENETFKSEGTYTWNADGTIITLQGEETPNQYMVGENTLTQLDVDGNKITSTSGANYTLRK